MGFDIIFRQLYDHESSARSRLSQCRRLKKRMLSWMILLYAHMHVDTLISMRQIKMDNVIYPMLKYGGVMNLQIVIC